VDRLSDCEQQLPIAPGHAQDRPHAEPYSSAQARLGAGAVLALRQTEGRRGVNELVDQSVDEVRECVLLRLEVLVERRMGDVGFREDVAKRRLRVAFALEDQGSTGLNGSSTFPVDLGPSMPTDEHAMASYTGLYNRATTVDLEPL